MADKMRGFHAIRELHVDVTNKIVASFKEHIKEH
jgi:hypothetical protein